MHLNSPDGRAVIAIEDGTVLVGSVSKRILVEVALGLANTLPNGWSSGENSTHRCEEHVHVDRRRRQSDTPRDD